jgi:hypothetical protein
VRFLVDRVALEKFVFSTSVSFMNIILPMLPTYLHLHFATTRRTNGGKPGNFKKSDVLSEMGYRWVEKYRHLIVV